MKITEQEKVFKEKINEYNNRITLLKDLLHNISVRNFSISIYHKKQVDLDTFFSSTLFLKTLLNNIYDEYTYLNELYREESK